MGTIIVGAMASLFTVWLIWRKKAPKLAVWVALLAGLTVGAGMLGGVATKLSGALLAAGTKGSAMLWGAAVPAVIGLFVLLELWHSGHPKKGKPHRYWHPLLAFLGPVLLVAAGGIFAHLAGWMDQGVDVVSAVLGSFVSR